MSDYIQVAMLGVQALALIGLYWYVVETMKIRKAAQQQVEGLSRPCITFKGELRNGPDAILEMHGATGNIIAAADQGSYVARNIGNGVALNIRYHFTRPNEAPEQARETRYVPFLSTGQGVTLVETLGGYNGDHDVTFDYESVSGTKYRTRIQLNHHVMTSFVFTEVKP